MGNFLLSNLDRTYTGEMQNPNVYNFLSKHLGNTLFAAQFETHTRLDFTGPPGSVSGLYYSLMFQLRKWEYYVQKFDEFVEVSPVHQQYYQLTIKQKQELEAQIKAGLASSAQSVADLELLLHDERKYREFLHYFGYEYFDESNSFKESDKKDEHSLKSVFIDLVDVHTGEGIAIKSIVQRWPTLIIDFMKLEDGDMDPDKVKEKLDISKAEAVVLVTKNKLYQEWKRLFGAEVQNRYRRIKELVRSRQSSVDQYREWLRPYVARHQMISEGLQKAAGSLSTAFIMPAGHATSYNEIVIWAWREFGPPEFYKGGTEVLAEERAEGKLDPYDAWTKKNLIFNKKHGLVLDYPWITENWIQEQKAYMMGDASKGRGGTPLPWIAWNKLYYTFFIITLEKTNLRMPTGAELEDGVFDVNFLFMGQNVLFAKLLELRAKQADFNHYIDNLLGIRDPNCPVCTPKGKGWEDKGKNRLGLLKKLWEEIFGRTFMFAKRGPYERDFDDRITKYYLRPAASGRFFPVISFIKQKMGVGQ